jgi:hypothetical protein
MLVDGQATTSILIEFGNLKNIMNTIDLIQQFPIYSNNPGNRSRSFNAALTSSRKLTNARCILIKYSRQFRVNPEEQKTDE